MIFIAIKSWFRKEKRAGTPSPAKNKDFSGEGLLHALMADGGRTVTKAEALNIPSVQGCINFTANVVSSIPVKLYRENDGKAEEVSGDNRIRLLNDDTGDTLNSVQFWRALVTDYWLGKGGYAYIRRDRNSVISLHYVDESAVSINENADPIIKDYDILVNGEIYKSFEFIKILRNSKNGASGRSIMQDNQLILSVAYHSLKYEENLVKSGGNKKGVIKAQKRLSEEAINFLRSMWLKLYGNNNESIVVLNEGLDFQEISNSSVDMQLRENKEVNAVEICRLFNFAAGVINGTASETEHSNAFKTGVMPVLKTIECALNRDLLLEKEKQSYYFAFDTKEILKGDIKSRFEAYKTGIDAKFLQIDEVRFMEDLPALGLNWINLGLDSVLYDIKTGKIYTPNTNQISDMKEGQINANRDTE